MALPLRNHYDPVARLLGTVLKSSGNTTLDAALYAFTGDCRPNSE
jgi:hypothetical protein